MYLERQKQDCMETHQRLKILHAHYCRLTGLELRWSYEVESCWFGWFKEMNTVEDLELTIKYLNRLYQKRPDILASCLRLRRLIGDTLFFSQMLAEAKKIIRVRTENEAKASVLRATGRPTEEVKDAVPVSRVLESEAFQNFCKLKEKL